MCDVCGTPPRSQLTQVTIEGRTFRLCRTHADLVTIDPPSTLAEAEALFGSVPLDRRSEPDRRGIQDRRMFPPRPELRRASHGRRTTDPKL